MDNQRLLDVIISTLDESPCAEQMLDCIGVLEAFKAENPHVERAYNRYLREQAMRRVAYCGEDVKTAESLIRSIGQMLYIDAQIDLDAFIQCMEWEREPHKRFYRPRRRVLYPVVRDLQDLFDGKLDYYTYSCPPRTGKSTLGCFYMAFCMGSNPDDANVMTGYSDKLTASFHTEVLSLITDQQYCFSRIFPEAPLKGSNMANETISLAHKRRFPTLTCRSAIGTLTGAVEVGRKGHLYCDDMVEDYEQALSSDRMQKLYEAYLSQLADRKLDGARELHIGTRWVPNDVIGRLEELHEGDVRFRKRAIPALNEQGTSNFEYDFGLGFSTKYYTDMRDALISAGLEDEWLAKYMCAPIWKEGVLFELDELNRFEELPCDEKGERREPDAVYAVVDSKTRGEDYCVMPIVYIYGQDHYVVDVICSDSVMDRITPRIVDKICEHGVDMCRFESNVAGGAIAREVGEECRKRGSGVSISTRYSTETKETRIEADSGWIKQRCLFRNSGDNEYELFMRFLTSYSAKGKNKHDDVPDAMSLYRRFVGSTAAAKVEAVKRPW